MMKKILLYLLLVSLTIYAQVENAYTGVQTQPNFYQDFLNFHSNKPGYTRIDVFIQVPYSEVQFVLVDKNFVAKYSVSISVYDEEKEKLFIEKTWSEELKASEFRQTISKNNFNLSLRSLELKPGRYHLRSSVDDKESSRSYVSENTLVVRNMSYGFALSDILLLAKNVDKDVDKKMLPNISRDVSVSKLGIPVFFEIYSDKKKTAKFEFSILDDQKTIVSQNFEEISVDSGITRIYHTYSDTSLPLGSYSVYIAAKGNAGENLGNVTKTFTSRWAGIPYTIKDLDKAIQQMMYIATEEEIEKIQDAENKEEKVKRYLEFWKKKDTVPETEENEIFNEYYRRIEYANKNFSHYSEGWRTDRGMVFIILGAPNNVDRHPFDYNAKPYEIWEYYNINRSFVFVDETGFGDYRLITPLYGDNYRFR